MVWSSRADAFCGFYVSGADAKMWNDATQVALMRDGTRTVLSMQNDYKGPPEDFALVIPVPVVLQKENVKTLAKDVFERLDTLTAPRLVEYWEQDPCMDRLGTIGHGAGTGTGQGFGSGFGRLGGAHATEPSVRIEAQFEVGEYEILILSAKDSVGLDTWLRENKYKIPDNAEPVLKPYVEAGSKFFVAKVNIAKVKLEDVPSKGGSGAPEKRAALSPLRFHYDTERLELPVKLGLLNSSGTQDLIVYVIGEQRYAVANYPNVTIPTNLDVSEKARDGFGSFYASLFDHTLEKNPSAVVTEYAWGATSCDPCPGAVQGMSAQDLASLGGDVLPYINMKASVALRQGATTVNGKLPPEVIQRIVRQNFGRFRLCHEQGSKKGAPGPGSVVVKLVIDGKGEVQSAKDEGSSTLADKEIISCVTKAFSGLSFPEPEDHKPVTVIYPILFNANPTVSLSKNLTVTRLHARYGKESLGSDLVFKVAEPIVGGREFLMREGDGGATGTLEHGARPSEGASSSFQARYAIRHPWTGPIDCKEPVRNVWTGAPPRPEDASVIESTKMQTATKVAFAPRNAALASFTTATGAQLDGTRVNPDGGVDVAPPSRASDAGGDGGKGGAPSSSKCGCRAVGATPGDAENVFGALVLGMLATCRRRRPDEG